MTYLPFDATKGNHLKYGFGNEMTSLFRSSPLEVARMSIGGIPVSDKSFMETLEMTSLELLQRHPGRLMLFLSGGLDSEIALRCFLGTNLDFNVAIVRFSKDRNAEDVSSAVSLCQAADISPVMIDFDPLTFFESGRWQDQATKYQCHTFYQQILASIAEDLSCPLLTVDEVEIAKLDDGKWAFIKKEDQDGCWHRFMQATGIPAYNNFYTYDPSTILRFFDSPTVVSLINDELFGKLSWTSSKLQIYKELTGWSLDPRPKRHGMEMMMDIWYRIQNETSLILPGPPVVFSFPVDDLRNSLKNGDEIQCNIIQNG